MLQVHASSDDLEDLILYRLYTFLIYAQTSAEVSRRLSGDKCRCAAVTLRIQTYIENVHL